MTTFFLTPTGNSCDADQRAKYKRVYDRYIELLAKTDFAIMNEKDININYYRGKLTTDLYSKIKELKDIKPLPASELECRQYESNIKYLYQILLSKGVKETLNPTEILTAGKRKTKKNQHKKRKTLRKKLYGKMH